MHPLERRATWMFYVGLALAIAIVLLNAGQKNPEPALVALTGVVSVLGPLLMVGALIIRALLWFLPYDPVKHHPVEPGANETGTLG